MLSAEPNEEEEGTRTDDCPKVVPADELFAGKTEVWIDLDGVRYRLRITKRGKLILQK